MSKGDGSVSLAADRSDDEEQDRADLLSFSSAESGGLGDFAARHRRRMFRYLYSRLPDYAKCEDLTQEVFIRLCRGGYDGTASPKTWMFTIARRVVIDAFRAESRRPPAGALGEEWGRQERGVSDPARNLHREDEDRRIRRWLGELPDEQAEAVRLRIIAGLSFAQTAEVLSCSVPTAKSRVRYGLMKLRTLIEEENKHD
jgi:RNA polymerase sigma-70 factor, ECF subfamily